jgi:hypothetical protein
MLTTASLLSTLVVTTDVLATADVGVVGTELMQGVAGDIVLVGDITCLPGGRVGARYVRPVYGEVVDPPGVLGAVGVVATDGDDEPCVNTCFLSAMIEIREGVVLALSVESCCSCGLLGVVVGADSTAFWRSTGTADSSSCLWSGFVMKLSALRPMLFFKYTSAPLATNNSQILI